MIELIALGILGLTDAAIMAGFYLYVREQTKERANLLNVIISKNATELRDLQLTQKVEKIAAPTTDPNFIPVSDLDDSDFSKAIGIDE